jgi:long-chain acyl-CoA synthetase
MLATWMLGRTIVPLNYLLSEQEMAYVIDDAGVDTVITVTPMLKHVTALPEHVTQIRLDEMKFGGFPPLRRTASRRDDHLAALLYTSGTSGRPKGVMLTNSNLQSNIRQCIETCNPTSGSASSGSASRRWTPWWGSCRSSTASALPC